MLLPLLSSFGCAWLTGCSGAADAQGGPPQAPPISVAPAVQRTVSNSEEFSGRIEASEFVELRPRVAGTVERVHSPTVRWSHKASCCSRSTRGPSPPSWRAPNRC